MMMPFPQLGAKLAEAGYVPPNYTAIWQEVARGAVPQVVRRKSRLFFDENDVEAIAAALNIQRVQQAG